MKARINITISPELLKNIDEICAQSCYTRSKFILRCIRYYLNHLNKED